MTAALQGRRGTAPRACGRPLAAPRLTRLATVSLALLALVSAVAGCGDSFAADVAPYLGTWSRVEGGEPDPVSTLVVTRTDKGAEIVFSGPDGDTSETVAATVVDDSLACVLPSGSDLLGEASLAPAGASGATAVSDVRLSLGEDGQLVVDLVLADGTLEPILIYERVSGVATAGP